MAIQKITTPIIGDAAVTTDKINNDFVTSVTTNPEFQGTSHIKVPAGTTAQRPASPAEGMVRYNTESASLEQYTALGWVSIASPPVISSVSPTTELGSDDPQQIIITGANFDGSAYATVFGDDGTQYTPTTSVRNSSTQITITFAGGDVLTGANEPYDVRVFNSTGLDATLADAFNINDVPTWVTASGSLATVVEDEAMTPVTVSATDPESVGIAYSVESGALPTGVSINSSTGSISGTPNVNDSYNSSGVVHNFTLGANDGAQTITRAFSILRKWRDGSTSALAASSAVSIYNVGVTTNGYYYLNLDGTPRQFYCDMANGGWIMFAHWSASTTNGGSAAPGSTSYAAAIGGYSGATAAAVAAPTTAEDDYNNYGSLSNGVGGFATGPWVWDAYTRGTNTGGSWFRNASLANQATSVSYRPKIYGYSWTNCKYRFRLSAPGGQNSPQYNTESSGTNSMDGFQTNDDSIDAPYIDGFGVSTGACNARSHVWSYPFDGSATGGNNGNGYSAGSTTGAFISGNYTQLYTVSGTTNSTYNDVAERSFTRTANTIPPEFRIMSDQDSGNEDTYVRAWYVFLK